MALKVSALLAILFTPTATEDRTVMFRGPLRVSYCTPDKNFSTFRHACCIPTAKGACFDSVYAKKECCSRGWILVEPLRGYRLPAPTWPPLLQSSHSLPWQQEQHPAFDETQLAWERMMGFAERWREFPSRCKASSTHAALSSHITLMSWRLAALPDSFNFCNPDHDNYGLLHWDALRRSSEEVGWVIDVGGHIGDVTVVLAEAYPKAKILVLEPNPLNYRTLLHNLKRNNLTNRVWPLQLALSEQEQDLDIAPCVYGGYGGHSSGLYCITDAQHTQRAEILMPSTSGEPTSIFHHHKVKAVPLAMLMQRLNTSELVALKLDCEGCEHDLLDSPSWGILRNSISRVVGEVHSRSKPGQRRDCNSITELEEARAELQ
eukprot:TRINITY_DN29738_c0_g1_i1.p1 TRINITY_DN29738_c0_g1~~TRINITY_DN29738_c0_g1_i1.p1  ORF type:complete len:376 (+),score=44.55 TRINITY_DN29738_c0_g1_i1:38-1165(+)